MKLRIASPVICDSIVDGPGLRMVIWTQGCKHNCKGCHNPQTHSLTKGYEVDTKEIINKIEDQEKNSQQELQEKIKTMEEDWKIINRKTAFYIEHEELEKVNASMIKFKSYIQLEEYTEAIPELENCKYILDHIREKEKMQIINLF